MGRQEMGKAMATAPGRSHGGWTNRSVLAFASRGDPVTLMVDRCRALVFDAVHHGWAGPPFDPFALAEKLQIPVVPRDDIVDARTVPRGSKRIRIEFNPNRPKSRIRYSIAHEIAHTLFPDCGQRIRNRLMQREMADDDWQLEMLCNVGAAEILMPVGSFFPKLKDAKLSIDSLMELRRQYQVSSEAILMRVVRLSGQPCAMFAASRRLDRPDGRYQIDYARSSSSWERIVPSGLTLPSATIVAGCTAIGFTACGTEEWSSAVRRIHIECVGIPPYPNRLYPRVAGIITNPRASHKKSLEISYIKGDASRPRGKDTRIIAQIVNNRATTWGAGFARQVRTKWPHVQETFRLWASAGGDAFALGSVHLSDVDDNLSVASMICQRGYGQSRTPRIDYNSVEKCLQKVASAANDRGASVHMPRIGTGEAGGSWEITSELVYEQLCKRQIAVTVYDLP